MSLDRIDHALLLALEQNSRISLKTLAKELNVKTSTIYHRLHKLKESSVLDSFTIVLNPDQLGLVNNYSLKIKSKKMVSGPLDMMFLETLSKYLSENYNEVLFSSIGDDAFVHCIATFRTTEHFDAFIAKLKENPYVDSVEVVKLEKILKGKKLFSYVQSDLDKEEDMKDQFNDSIESAEDGIDDDMEDGESFEIDL